MKTAEAQQKDPIEPSRAFGLRWVYNYFARATGGLPVFPLGMLFAVFFIDEFDTQAFGVLTPEIRHAFHLTDQSLGYIVFLNATIVLLAGLPLGYYADRLPRRTFVWIGAFMAGVFSFLTGVTSILWLFIFIRLGNGTGLAVNSGVHPSLLADYYKPEDWPSVYSVHLNAPRLGAIIGPAVAGIVAQFWGWQWAFIVLIVPLCLVGFFAIRLREPLRGGTQDREAAEVAALEKPQPFDRAIRTVMSIKTLKRQYIAWIFIGAGFIPLSIEVPLLLDRRFHVDPFGRGAIGAAGAAAAFAGVMYSRSLTQRWMAKGLGEPLKWTGWVLVAVGIGLGWIAASPVLWLAIVAILFTSCVGGIFWVPFTYTAAMVAPARVRTLALSVGNAFLIAGVWLLVGLPGLLAISDREGPQWAMAAAVPYWIIGGLVLRSGRGFVLDDATRSLEMLQMTAAMREERMKLSTDRLLVVKSIDVAYDQTQVLFGVDFEVREGELVALLGTNGAGKSTLLKAISGLIHPIKGAMFFDGEDITFHDPEETAELGIIQMPGGKSVFPSLTVRENLEMAAWLYYKDQAHVKASFDNVCEVFPVLEQRMEQQAGSLSGGEQQMLSLAQAFIAKPKLLMIDELSLGLAPVIVQQLLEIVKDLNARGVTIILVEQSVNVALTVAKHAYFMEKGQIRFDGSTDELLKRSDILRSVFLEGAQAVVGGNGAKTRKASKK